MTKPIAYEDQISKEFLWTIERYERAIEAGIFTEDDKIELLYGKIIELMPAGTPHEECVTMLADFFRDRFGKEFRYREEKAINLPRLDAAPEPDFVVVVNKPYGKRRPEADDIHFIAEVARTSLGRDRTVKVALYAEANLAEYWIVNLVNRQIEVHLKPDPEQGIYESINIYKEGNTFTSPFAGDVAVAELLPDLEEE